MSVTLIFHSYMGQKTTPFQKPVISRTTVTPPDEDTPPVVPTKGDRYIIPVGATHSWAPYPGYFAERLPEGVWFVYPPNDHGVVYVVDEGIYIQYDPATSEYIPFVPHKKEKQVSVPDTATTNINVGEVAKHAQVTIHFTMVYAGITIGGEVKITNHGGVVEAIDATWGPHANQYIPGISFAADVNAGNIRLKITAAAVGGASKFRYTRQPILLMT